MNGRSWNKYIRESITRPASFSPRENFEELMRSSEQDEWLHHCDPESWVSHSYGYRIEVVQRGYEIPGSPRWT